MASTNHPDSDLSRKGKAATADKARWLAERDASMDRALDDAKSGRVRCAAEVLDRLQARYAAMSKVREAQ